MLFKYCEALETPWETVLAQVGWKEGDELTVEQHGKALTILKEIERKRDAS